MSGPGRITIFGQNQGAIWGRIYNFEISSHTLKPEHQEFLRRTIAPILSNGGSIRLIGLASRSGPRGFNHSLSQGRLDAVSTFLRSIVHNPFQIGRSSAQGEDAAALAGIPDGQEHPNWRSVVFSAWHRPDPPPRIERPPQTQQRTFPQYVRREWLDQPRMGRGMPDDSPFFTLGTMASRIINPDSAEVNPQRREIPENHLVNVIRLLREESRARISGVTLATMNSYVITYEWGPPRPQVQFYEYGNPVRMLSREEARPWIDRPGMMIYRGFA